jgi:hypothetical protein
VDVQETDRQILQLLEGAMPVPGTSPPVYMVDGVLIGYDKLKQIKIIATEHELEPLAPSEPWHLKPFEPITSACIKLKDKLVALIHHSDFAAKN